MERVSFEHVIFAAFLAVVGIVFSNTEDAVIIPDYTGQDPHTTVTTDGRVVLLSTDNYGGHLGPTFTLVNPSGLVLTEPVKVDSFNEDYTQRALDTVTCPGGGFYIIWQRKYAETGLTQIMARKFSNDTSPEGEAFEVYASSNALAEELSAYVEPDGKLGVVVVENPGIDALIQFIAVDPPAEAAALHGPGIARFSAQPRNSTVEYPITVSLEGRTLQSPALVGFEGGVFLSTFVGGGNSDEKCLYATYFLPDGSHTPIITLDEFSLDEGQSQSSRNFAEPHLSVNQNGEAACVYSKWDFTTLPRAHEGRVIRCDADGNFTPPSTIFTADSSPQFWIGIRDDGWATVLMRSNVSSTNSNKRLAAFSINAQDQPGDLLFLEEDLEIFIFDANFSYSESFFAAAFRKNSDIGAYICPHPEVPGLLPELELVSPVSGHTYTDPSDLTVNLIFGTVGASVDLSFVPANTTVTAAKMRILRDSEVASREFILPLPYDGGPHLPSWVDFEGLLDDGIYTVMANASGVISIASDVRIDTFTDPLEVASPLQNVQAASGLLSFTFTVPEPPLNQQAVIGFIPANAAEPDLELFAQVPANGQVEFEWIFQNDPVNSVAEIVAALGPGLADGDYDIRISYRDAWGNPPFNATIPSIDIALNFPDLATLAPEILFPYDGAVIQPPFSVAFSIAEEMKSAVLRFFPKDDPGGGITTELGADLAVGDALVADIINQDPFEEGPYRLELEVADAVGNPSATHAVELVLIVNHQDFDGNGMDDRWEREHFFVSGVAPNEDADGDGSSNLAEFLAATDPLDPTSYLKVTYLSGELGSSFYIIRLKSSAVVGKTYKLQGGTYSENGNIAWVDLEQKTSTSTEVEWTTDDDEGVFGFFRVVLVRE